MDPDVPSYFCLSLANPIRLPTVLRLTKSFTVVAGSFNIHAFRPDLLQVLIPPPAGKKSLQVQIQSDLFQPGFKFSFADTGSIWTIRPDRFVVETTSNTYNCGQMVANVLETLRWTPITAVGHNFRFSCEPHSGSVVRLPPDFCDPPAEYHLKQKTWHLALERDELTFNLALEQGKESVSLSSNIHCPFKEQRASSGKPFALRFDELKAASTALLTECFKQSS